MPLVDRIPRLLRLIELLQSGRSHNSTQIADALNVSRRTIFRDLRTLESSGIPVLFDEERQGYAILSNTLLPSADLTLEETISLLVVCHEAGDAKRGLPFHQAARTAALKLLSSLPNGIRDAAVEWTEAVSMRLDPRNPLDGAETYYAIVSRAIAERRQVRISYCSLDEARTISTALSPYRLLFSRRSWYVIGRSSLHREIRTFNVGRIVAAEILEYAFRIPQRFSLDRYLGNAWHLIRDSRHRYKVVVRFQKQVAQNVAEVAWHKTQKLTWNDDGTLDLQVTVDGLQEIQWWVLGYGRQAEVLEPDELRTVMQQHAAAMQRTYRSNQKDRVRKSKPRD